MKTYLNNLILHLKQAFVMYLIILCALMLKIAFISPYLEDWDSVQFALALDHFSLALQQPHPPGYPVYIFLAKVINIFTNNPTLSLELVSLISSILMLIPFYLLLKKVSTKVIATLGSTLLVITPVSWTLSEVALSNIPGMACMITSAYIIYLGRNSTKLLYLGSLFAGVTIGVRFAEYSMLLALIAIVLLYRKLSGSLYSLIFFCLGLSLWLIPMILYTGINEFIDLYTKQAYYISNHDSILKTSLRFRIYRLFQLFSWGYSLYFIPLIFVIVFGGLIKIKKLFGFSFIFGFTWLFSYLILQIFLYNTEVTRYLLPLLPSTILILALVLNELNRKFVVVTCYLLLIPIFLESFSQVSLQKQLIPPTILPIMYIKNHYPSDQTTLITTFTFRQTQYYLPQYTNHYGSDSHQEFDVKSKYLIIDYLGIEKQLPNLNNYKLVETKTFTGPEKIFPRLSETKLYIFEKQ